MSDTKQRSWRELLMEDFKATRTRSGDDSYGEMLARVDAWSAHLEQVESQNQALQERAERAEALLRELADALYDRRIYDNGIPQYEPTRNRKEVRLIHALNAARALSPTQETDPE